jgi:multidrug efflux pump
MIVMGVILLAAGAGDASPCRKSELAPEEDQGIVLSQIVGRRRDAQQMQTYAEQVFDDRQAARVQAQMFQITGVPTSTPASAACCSSPGIDRTRSAHEMQLDLQAGWNKIAGARSPRSSSRRCRARPACRCSSSSRPPSRSRI